MSASRPVVESVDHNKAKSIAEAIANAPRSRRSARSSAFTPWFQTDPLIAHALTHRDGIGFWHYDPTQQLVHFSPNLRKLLGLGATETAKVDVLLRTVRSADRPHLVGLFKDAISRGKAFQTSCQVRCRNLTSMTVDIAAECDPTPNGQFALRGVLQDLTDDDASVNKPTSQASFAKMALNLLPEPVVLIDEKFRLIVANTAWRRFKNLSDDIGLGGRAFADFLGDMDREWQAELRRGIGSGRSYELSLSGGPVGTWTIASPVLNAHKRLVGYLLVTRGQTKGTVTAATDSNPTPSGEIAIPSNSDAASTTLLVDLFDAVPKPVLVVDHDRDCVVMMNGAARDVFAVPSSLRDVSLSKIFADADAFRNLCEGSAVDRLVKGSSGQFTRSTGTDFFADFTTRFMPRHRSLSVTVLTPRRGLPAVA